MLSLEPQQTKEGRGEERLKDWKPLQRPPQALRKVGVGVVPEGSLDATGGR